MIYHNILLLYGQENICLTNNNNNNEKAILNLLLSIVSLAGEME